jgi:hypothetical protein
MAFTFKDNGTHPIAIISQGKRKKFVYLEKEGRKKEKTDSETSVVDQKDLDPKTIKYITDCLSKGTTIRDMYYTLLDSDPTCEKGSSDSFTFLNLGPDESIFPIPSDEPERYFIVGESGCGKSTICVKLALAYHKMFPKNNIWTFLRQDDEAYDKIPSRQEVLLGDETSDDKQQEEDTAALLNGEFKLKDFENSLVIFDDMDNIQSKKVCSAIHKLMGDCAANGRKKSIYVIYVSHIIKNREQTKVITNEASKVFLFPGCGAKQMETFLKEHAHLPDKECQSLAKMDSRWVMICRKLPRYIMSETGLMML